MACVQCQTANANANANVTCHCIFASTHDMDRDAHQRSIGWMPACEANSPRWHDMPLLRAGQNGPENIGIRRSWKQRQERKWIARGQSNRCVADRGWPKE
jgi:hypothetical protein